MNLFYFLENGEARQYTYQELNDVTNKIARTILEIKNINNLTSNSDGDYVVAVSMQPSDKLVIALLSIWKAGAAYLPLDEAFPEPRVEHILTESKPMMVIFDQGCLLAILPSLMTKITILQISDFSKTLLK